MNTKLISEVIDQFAITDAKGILRASNRRAAPPPPINLSDREHVRFHLQGSADTLFVAHPVIGRVSGLWLVPLSRRLMNADGSLGGVVTASLNPKHFTQFYQSIDLGHSGSISLIGLDGRVRSSGGYNGSGRLTLGQDITGTRLLSKVQGGAAGTFIDHTPEGNRIVTFRNIRNLPLAVSVSVTEDQVYAKAHRDLIRHTIIGSLLSLLIFGVGIKGSRDQLRLRLAKAKLLHSQRLALQKSEHLGLTLDNMGQGIILVTKDLRIPVINRQAVHLLDLPEDFLRSSPNFADLVSFQEARGEYASDCNFRKAYRHWSISRNATASAGCGRMNVPGRTGLCSKCAVPRFLTAALCAPSQTLPGGTRRRKRSCGWLQKMRLRVSPTGVTSAMKWKRASSG